MIRVRFYDTINDNNSNSTNQQQQQRFARKKRHHHKDIKDPLRLKRIAVPDMDKNWFKILIGNQLSQRRQPINITNIMTSLERLTNNDIIDLIFSSKFSFENFIIILKLIVEKHQQDSQQQGIVVVGSATKQHKQQQQQSLDAKEMAKFIVPIYCRFLQSILERFPLIHLFNMNNNNVDGDDDDNNNNVRKIDLNDIRNKLLIHDDYPFYNDLLQSFCSSFIYFIEHLSLFENYLIDNYFPDQQSSSSIQSIIIHLTIVYSTLLYDEQDRQNYQNILNILNVIENFLDNRTLFVQFGEEKFLCLQLTLINSIYYSFKHHYSISSMDNIFINFDLNYISFESKYITINDYQKIITMFHSLENDSMNRMKIPIPPPSSLYHRIMQRIILNICRLPYFNSLIYIPYNLLNSTNANIWNGIQSLTNLPIMASQFLCETEIFRQFLFRIANIGFINRIQFEEIWMTLLGVYSESISLITQYRQGVSIEELSEYILLTKLVIIAITNLLYNANTTMLSNDYHSDYSISDSYDDIDNNNDDDDKISSSFGEKYEQIYHIIHRKFHSDRQILKRYNDPILNHSFHYKFKSIHEFHFSSNVIERNQSESLQTQSSSSSSSIVAVNNNVQTSIDLYSCIQFLIDYYAQQIRSLLNKNLIHFPIITEIARSTLILSELFVDRNQYRNALNLFIDLQKIVENYDDEILGQFIGTGLCKFYTILDEHSDEHIERQKKQIFEKNFKEFFLPTRIHSIDAIDYMIDGKIIKTKDLQPLLDYIIKHLNTEHIIPSSYCKEYVEKLVRISFKLIDSNQDFLHNQNEKIIKGLIRLISKDININVIKIITLYLEKFIRQKKLNKNEAKLLRNLSMKRMNKNNHQSNQIEMLNMIINTTYLVETTNFNLETNNGDDDDDDDNNNTNDDDPNADGSNELFKTMEKLSIIFEPLRYCNSFDAMIICQVFGYFLAEFFPPQDILNKCIGEFLSKQQNHYKYLIEILFIIYSKLQIDCQHTDDTGEDWVILSLSSFTQLVPISHALWALTCFLICASHNHWIRSCYYYFQNRFGKFNEHDKRAFFTICNNFYNEIKSDDNKMSFIKTFQKAACVPNSPYFEVLQYLWDDINL